MLLEFEIENEGPFASEALFSLVASNRKETDNRAVRKVGDLADTKALTSALILGKNGSGKSTLISTLVWVSNFVLRSSAEGTPESKLPFRPNKLVEGFEDSASKIRLLFSVNETAYEFGFSYNEGRVLNEYMEVADKSPRFRRLYERKFDKINGKQFFSFGDALSGQRKAWADSTRENALFLSTAVQLNSEDLKAPYQWLTKFVSTVDISGEIPNYTTNKILADDSFRMRVVDFLKAMDINVDEIEIEEKEREPGYWKKLFAPEFVEEMRKTTGDDFLDATEKKVFFLKKSDKGELVRMGLRRESTGTRALYALAGPLYDALDEGRCLVVDEINTSLHPLVVKFLVDLFSRSDVNVKRAQLIFTSHDVSILRDEFLRRDQVWFLENDGCSAQLIPLSDYSPRRQEALENGYLRGRYGGVPTLSPEFVRHFN